MLSSISSNIRVINTKQCRFIYLLDYSFQTGSSSSHSYFNIFFLIAFLEEAFIRNII
jgi:hypothetical protein